MDIVIDITGPPKSGKTKLKAILMRFFEELDFTNIVVEDNDADLFEKADRGTNVLIAELRDTPVFIMETTE